MNDTTRLRDEIIALLDARFAAYGYKRRRDSVAWRRRGAAGVRPSLHVNFGLYPHDNVVSAVPTIGVQHDVIERALIASGLVTEADPQRVTFGQLLKGLAGATRYETTVGDGAEQLAAHLWADWCSDGQSAVDRLSDLTQVISMLRSTEPSHWCCFSRSMRARLLPLTLAAVGRRAEALDVLVSLGADVAGRDQLLPKFDHFEAWFRAQGA